MSRTRLIRPAFFKHGELYDAEQESGLPLRVAFAGLWTVADKPDGRFAWKPRDIKADVCPHDVLDFSAVLDALHRHGFVQRYVVDGKHYGYIPSFDKHQTFHKSEAPSKLPPPPPNGGPPVPSPIDHGVNREDAVAVTGTGTSSKDVVLSDSVILQPSDFALQITVAANNAVTKKWGEQTSPYVHGQSHSLAQELIDAGVPLDLAKASVAQQCEHSGRSGPPKSIHWFRPGILSAHEMVQQKAIQGANPPEPTDSYGLLKWAEDRAREEAAHA